MIEHFDFGDKDKKYLTTLSQKFADQFQSGSVTENWFTYFPKHFFGLKLKVEGPLEKLIGKSCIVQFGKMVDRAVGGGTRMKGHILFLREATEADAGLEKVNLAIYYVNNNIVRIVNPVRTGLVCFDLKRKDKMSLVLLEIPE